MNQFRKSQMSKNNQKEYSKNFVIHFHSVSISPNVGCLISEILEFILTVSSCLQCTLIETFKLESLCESLLHTHTCHTQNLVKNATGKVYGVKVNGNISKVLDIPKIWSKCNQKSLHSESKWEYY